MINRECRRLTLPPQRSRMPNRELFADFDPWSMHTTATTSQKKPLPAYRARDIVKENKRQQICYRARASPVREVPAFTIQAQQKNTRTTPPASVTRLTDTKTNQWNNFRLAYDRGDLPVQLDHGGCGDRFKSLRWLKDPTTMDVDRQQTLLTRFCIGLPLLDQRDDQQNEMLRLYTMHYGVIALSLTDSEQSYQPYRFIAERGVADLLTAIRNPNVIINCYSQMVPALRAALYSSDLDKRKNALRLVIRLTKLDSCGPALVPYYRQLLPPLRVIEHSGLQMDINYQYGASLAELIETTLGCLERTGGPNAYINIKYIIPTYQSCTGAH